jgi:hypothetical protein
VAGEMRILFITFASHTPSQSDYNHFQRVDFLSRRANLTVWARKGADFSASARPGTPIVHARLGGKLGLVLQVFAYSLIGRARGFDVVLTEPSLLSLAGLMCKAFGAGKWVVDVWDVPGRSGGERGQLARAWLRLNRYILKQGFKFADFFLLSIRPDYEFRYFNRRERIPTPTGASIFSAPGAATIAIWGWIPWHRRSSFFEQPATTSP